MNQKGFPTTSSSNGSSTSPSSPLLIGNNNLSSSTTTGDLITIHVQHPQITVNNTSNNKSLSKRKDAMIIDHHQQQSNNHPSSQVFYPSSSSFNNNNNSFYHLLYDTNEPICPPDFTINIKLFDQNNRIESIHVHKVFLALSSPYFRTLINSEFSESANSQVEFELTIFEKEVFENILLRYIYGERILSIDKGNTYACTLCLAHFLQINALEYQLFQQMSKTAKYTQQHLHYYTQLVNHPMLAVNSGFLSQSLIFFGKDIFKKREEVLQLPLDLFIWLISLDNLNVTNEDEVYDLINEYIERNENKILSLHSNNQLNNNNLLINIMVGNDNIFEVIWNQLRFPFLSDEKILQLMDNDKMSSQFKIQMLKKRQMFLVYEKSKKKTLSKQVTNQSTTNTLTTTTNNTQQESNSGSETPKHTGKESGDQFFSNPTGSSSLSSSTAGVNSGGINNSTNNLYKRETNEFIIDLSDPQFIKRGNIIEHLITGSKGVIQIWDLNTNECLVTLQTESFVRCLALYDHNYLLSGGHDKKVRKWNLRTNECEVILKGHSDYVLSFALIEDYLFSAGGVGDSTVRKWNLLTNQCEATLTGHSKAVLSLVAFKDIYVFSGGEDSTIRKWNVRTNQCEQIITASLQNDDKLWCLSVYDDKYLFAGGSKGKIYQFNIETGECEMEWIAHDNIVWCLLVFEDTLFSGSKDKTIKKWNLEKKKDNDMEMMAIDTTTQIAATSSSNNLVNGYECEAIFREHADSVRSLNIYNGFLFSGGGDEKIIKWNLLTNQKEAVLSAEEYICSGILA
ncbi:hypothetical protein ABK040_011378 [Willaertia magna]